MKVFAKPLKFEYRTRFLSQATVFYFLISICFRFLVPLTIVWCTDSMWIKQSSFVEMPEVEFKRKLILVVEGEGDGYFRKSFTTFPGLNSALEGSNEYFPASIEDYETDTDNDGISDRINLKITCHQLPGTVRRVEALLFFNYRLSSHMDLRMESFVHVSAQHWTAARKLSLDGTVTLFMRRPFFYSGYDFRYNHSLISGSGKYITNDYHAEDEDTEVGRNGKEIFDLERLVQRHFDRDYFLQLSPVLEQWKSIQLPVEPSDMVLKLQLRIEPQAFAYETSFGFLLKWAIVQYCSIFLLVNWAVGKLENAIYCRWFLFPTVRFANENLKNVYEKLH